MNVSGILRKAISDAGGNGLCNPGESCGCGIDDLAPGIDCLNLEDCQIAKWVKPAKDNPDYIEEFEDGYYKVLK